MTKVVTPSLIDNLTKRQLIELDACVRCSECLYECPVYEVTKERSLTMMEKLRIFRRFVTARHGLKARLFGPSPVDEGQLIRFTEDLYKCTVCGDCAVVCPVGIHCQELWPALRAKMVQLGYGPIGLQKTLPAIVKEKHNPFNQPHDKRTAWMTPDIKVADKAELGFYMGCGLHYVGVPMLEGAVKILNAASVPFTSMLEDEWDCGFPLYIIGELGQLEELVKHNVEGLVERGVKRLIIQCPCCLNQIQNVWPKYYGGKLPFKLVHITQVVADLIDQGKLKFTKHLNETVTYHDPCYLARGQGEGFGVIEEPRKIIRSFPGVNFVELEKHGVLTRCCGAGGGIRRAYGDLATEMAFDIVKAAEKTGAKTIITNCPACYERVRLSMEVKRFAPQMKVVDLLQLAAVLL